jgi:hypothetical protein
MADYKGTTGQRQATRQRQSTIWVRSCELLLEHEKVAVHGLLDRVGQQIPDSV